MPKIAKDTITNLEIPEDLKAELIALFGQIDEKENELAKIRTKVPTDSQKVVESVDFDKYQSAVKELERLKSELAKKLESNEETEDLFDYIWPFNN